MLSTVGFKKLSKAMLWSAVATFVALCLFSFLESAEAQQVDRSKEGIVWHKDDILINDTEENVLKILGDYGNYKEWYPYLNKSRVLYQRGFKGSGYFEAKIMDALMWMRLDIDHIAYANVNKIKAKMVAGNVKSFDLEWEVIKVNNDTTQVILRMRGDAGLSVPDSMVNDYNRKIVRKALVNLRTRLLLGNY